MSSPVVQIQNLTIPKSFKGTQVDAPPAAWTLAEVAGRMVEISGSGAGASLTLAFGLVLVAQQEAEPVGWITSKDSSFFPPDAAEGGIDLEGLVVVRVPNVPAVPRAGDRLVRSGAFGLVVLDLGVVGIPMPLQARLAGLAQNHHTALVCLTAKDAKAPSLGSLISLHARGKRKRLSQGQFACELTVLKDKRRGPTWTHSEKCHGPSGLC